MRRQETTYYLEMTDPGELRASPAPRGDLKLTLATVADPQLNRFFYSSVGRDWYWIDRLAWPRDQWLAWLDRPGHETWTLEVAGTPAGYFELDCGVEAAIEIAYLGLLPEFVGRGLGGYLLSEATRRAWEKGASRVWLHTSSFDHPAALANYRSRGFRLFKTEITYKDLPDRPPG